MSRLDLRSGPARRPVTTSPVLQPSKTRPFRFATAPMGLVSRANTGLRTPTPDQLKGSDRGAYDSISQQLTQPERTPRGLCSCAYVVSRALVGLPDHAPSLFSRTGCPPGEIAVGCPLR